jgi:hypothetical protein
LPREKTIVTVCASGHRSNAAARTSRLRLDMTFDDDRRGQRDGEDDDRYCEPHASPLG